jgi:hypothetical protein
MTAIPAVAASQLVADRRRHLEAAATDRRARRRLRRR